MRGAGTQGGTGAGRRETVRAVSGGGEKTGGGGIEIREVLMGTRHLIAVMADGKYKLAQYGQWDGYPSGQGAVVLDFCRKRLKTTKGRNEFRKALDRVRFVPTDEHKAMWEAIGAFGEFVSFDKSDEFKKLHPYFSRDNGAKILEMTLASTGPVETSNSIDFAGDSLMCEYAYVIDLDKGTFEAFKGFNHKPLDPNERFASMPVESNPNVKDPYFQVRHVKTYSLDDLPTKAQFVKECEPSDEDEETTDSP